MLKTSWILFVLNTAIKYTPTKNEKTEEKILNGIISLKNEMTIIIVSHNKNTLKFCDKIIDLNSFKLVN